MTPALERFADLAKDFPYPKLQGLLELAVTMLNPHLEHRTSANQALKALQDIAAQEDILS